ncbi:MAG TPA: HAMP domain-containing sensor histidine kinase [bacterium]|nr:HAMP domain-containing sensor histidine kinase [bacterium]
MTAASTIAAVVLTGALLIRSHRDSVRRQLEATASALISLGISDFEDLENFDGLSRFIEGALQMERVDKIIRIYTSNGRLAFSTARLQYDKLPSVLPKLTPTPYFLEVEGKRQDYESLVIPYVTFGQRKPFYLQIAIPLPSYAEIFEHLWWQSLLLLGLLMGLAFYLARRLSARLIRPVDFIAAHLEGMDPTRVEDWSPLNLKDAGPYLEAIVRRINALSDRTRAAVLQIRKMGRYVAHELRTPLTILQGEAETALARTQATKTDYETVLKSSLEEIQRMSEIVASVLQVGEWERSEVRPDPVVCDLSGWIRENDPRWEKTLGKPLDVTLPAESPQVRMDPRLTNHLIDNLIRNVRKHAPESPCRLRVSGDPSRATLTISDDGPGLPEEILNALNRDEPVLDVAGVGLNLCQKIAKIGGMKLRFANRPGRGLDAEILFPSSR